MYSLIDRRSLRQSQLSYVNEFEPGYTRKENSIELLRSLNYTVEFARVQVTASHITGNKYDFKILHLKKKRNFVICFFLSIHTSNATA